MAESISDDEKSQYNFWRKIMKRKVLYTRMFASLAVLAVVLVMAVGALAATAPFTLNGLLAFDGGTGVYSVKGVAFEVNAATVCTDGLGAVVADCSTLAGQLVTVVGSYDDEDVTVPWVAGSITVVSDPATVFTHEGELMAFDAASWTIDAFVFEIGASTFVPPFFAVGDTVMASYTVEAGTGDYLANAFTVLESAGSYTFAGELMAFTDTSWTVGPHTFLLNGASLPPFFAVGDQVEVTFDIVGGEYLASAIVLLSSGEGNTYVYEGVLMGFTDTTWTVDTYTFLLNGVALPPFFAVGDTVKVTFMIVDGEFIAIALEVIETVVPVKVESARCDNRLKDHPAILKLAADVGEEDPDVILGYFCDGFGIGEIMLAYKWAENSEYTPAMLLALRSSGDGMGWGHIKKLAQGSPMIEEPEEPEVEEPEAPEMEETEEMDQKTNGKPETSGKPETTGKPETAGKPETTGKPEATGKPEKATSNGKGKNK
jgi:hypothetical protein